jgi:hypothetical protein
MLAGGVGTRIFMPGRDSADLSRLDAGKKPSVVHIPIPPCLDIYIHRAHNLTKRHTE